MDLDGNSGRWFGLTGYALAALGIAVAVLAFSAVAFIWWIATHGSLGPD